MSITRPIKIKHVELLGSAQGKMHNSSVSILIEQAHNDLTMAERHVNLEMLETFKSVNYESLDGGFFMHLTTYSDGSGISIVPKSKELQKGTVSEQKAPDHGDYLNKECFLYLFDEHVIIVSYGLRETQVEKYLFELLRKARLISDEQSLQLQNLANPDVIAKIKKHGVKRVWLKSRIDKGTWSYAKLNEKNLTVRGKILSALGQILSKDPEVDEEEIYDYNFDLAITNKGVLEAIEKDPLTKTAVKIFSDEQQDGASDEDYQYEIELNDGMGEIKEHQLCVSDTITISRIGNSLDYEKVKLECLAYKRRLIGEGIIQGNKDAA